MIQAVAWGCVALDWHPELEGRTLGTLWASGVVRFYEGATADDAARRAAAEELGGRMLVLVGSEGAPAFIFHVVRTSSCGRGLGAWLFQAEVELRVYELTLYWQRACAELQVVRFNERCAEGSEVCLDGSGLVRVQGRAFVNDAGDPVVRLRKEKIPVRLDRLRHADTGPFGWSSTLRRALMGEV
ncbi:hypothetical protein OV203_01375 [Nannocystis sp. ILAH1]|uniref:hypothetical protein n=1 Tax=Nannocystis sp. ILAH1 TaxID=2996789 RepID=UPI00226F3A61|nr:hypothetical protein [Nannocystis sp. ILAH1]MCY0985761.1 hypothetical protein [Nannocystis sp. ILAH1]